MIEHFKSAKTVSPDQKVIIPREPELEAELNRKVNGIPLVDAVAKDLNELAEKFGFDCSKTKYIIYRRSYL